MSDRFGVSARYIVHGLPPRGLVETVGSPLQEGRENATGCADERDAGPRAGGGFRGGVGGGGPSVVA